jgi:IS5 family transposase
MQTSFSELEYVTKRKQTRQDRFLAEIEAVTPWAELEAVIEPFYPKGEGRGRPTIGLGRMLRMYVVQNCFGLSDEGIEDAIYDSPTVRRYVASWASIYPASRRRMRPRCSSSGACWKRRG